MDSNQLFWATGIKNNGLRTDAQQAEEIFRKLSVNVNKHLDSIIQKYKELQNTAKVKFENPVDPQMISSIKSQIGELINVIDAEINKLGKFTATYDQSMQKIKAATAKISSGGGGGGGGKSSPLTPMVEGIRVDVAKADKELSFLARRFKYMWGSVLAYGSLNVLKTLGSDIIRVKQQFEYAQVAIDSFVGSAEGGKKVFQDLMAFAVKSPMQMEDVTEAAKQMLAYGDAADTVVESVKMLSDVSAGSGQNLKDIAYLYGTSMTQGRLYQRDLFQFANRGIPVYDALAKTMGKSKEQILALTSAGQVGFPELQKAIESLTAAGGQYYGLSEKMAEKTSGQISNLKDKWTMALKDIGDSQDGLINNSVQGITYLISNWEALAKAITATVAVLGTYQVAKSMVSWEINAKAAAANIAEAQSLEVLVSAEAKANIAKQSLVVGTAEYAAAIKAEVVLIAQKAAATEAAAIADFKAANIAMDSAIQQSVAAQANLASKRQLIAASTGEVTAAELVAAKTAVQTTQLNANTAARELKIASSKLGIATSNKEAIASGISTAALAGEKVGTDLVAAAKIRLTAITATLNRTISAHPIGAAVVAITALVAIIWALHDSTTEAEKAQKRLAESIKGVQTAADDKIKGFNDRLNIIKSETAAAADQEKAYRELQMAYKDIIGDMTLKDLKTKESTVLQKANADAVAESRVAELKSLADATKARIDADKKLVDYYNTLDPMLRQGLIPVYSRLHRNEQLLKDQTALYEQAQADLDKSKEDSEKTPIFDKSHWEALKKEATDTLNGIASSTKRALDAGKETGIDTDIVSAYKKAKSDIALADKELLTYNDKPQDDLEKQKRITQERLDAIARDTEKIKDAETKANIELDVANLASLDDGYAKEKELQKIKFDEKILAIKKEGEKLLEEQNKITTNQWYVDNPNYIKEKKTPPADATKLSDANQSIIDKKVKAAELEDSAATTKLLKDKLLEYGNYATERLEIERKYNADIAALEAERTTTNAASIDSAIRQANVEKSKALMAHSFKKLKESPEFAMAFEDLGNVSTETLEKLMAELNKYQQTAAGAMRLSDFKEYASVIENITDQLIERNPFKVLKESQDELEMAKSQLSLAKTTEDVAKAQDNVNRAYNKGEKARKEILDDTQELMDKFSSIGDAIGGTAGEIISYIGDIGSFVTASISGITKMAATGAAAIGAVEKASIILGVLSTAIQLLKQLDELIPDADDKYDKYSSRISDINKMTAAVDDYQLAVMRAKNEEDSWFGSDSISSLSDAYEEAMKASESYYARLNQQQAEYKNKSGQGWRTKISPFFNLYAALLQPNDAYKKKLVAARENLRIETRSASSGFLGSGIGGHSQKTEDLTSWIKKNLGFDLFDEKGNLNTEAYDVIMSKYSDKLVGETKQTLEDLKKLKEEHDAAMDAFKEYVDSMYAPIADAWVDAIWDWVDSGKDAMDSFKDYASDTFRDIVSDLIRTLVLKNIVGTFSDDIQAAYTQYASGNMTEQALMAEVAELTAQMQGRAVAQTDAIQDVTKTIVDGLKATTGIDVTKDADTDANSTRSAIQSMSQESADILTAQFSAMRINIDKIRVEMGGIGGNMTVMNINVKDILLSLQSQAASLQMVFSDISRIARNTDRLEAIENTLGKIVTNGVTAL